MENVTPALDTKKPGPSIACVPVALIDAEKNTNKKTTIKPVEGVELIIVEDKENENLAESGQQTARMIESEEMTTVLHLTDRMQ